MELVALSRQIEQNAPKMSEANRRGDSAKPNLKARKRPHRWFKKMNWTWNTQKIAYEATWIVVL